MYNDTAFDADICFVFIFYFANATRLWQVAAGLHKQLHSFHCGIHDEDSVRLVLSVDWPHLCRLGFNEGEYSSPLRAFYKQPLLVKIF